jgi:hypothetical protein
MTRVRPGIHVMLAAFLVLAASAASRAQPAPVTNDDVQRLEAGIEAAARDVADARGRDAALASELQSQLDDVRDEATYLKVKLRRREPIERGELTSLSDRLANIRSRARGDAPPARERARVPGELPVGTEFDARLQSPLSSATAQVEDRFEATTMVDLRQDDDVLVPAGSLLRGVVRSVNKATRVDRKGSLTVDFDRITIGGRSYPIRATVTQALESEGIGGEKGKIGAGAGVGAIIGGLLGGVKGAIAGILVGGGGVLAATEGKDVQLDPGAVLRVRLDEPLDVRER